MTPDELKAHGQRLYGHRWQTKLAVAVGVAPRTVRRWAKGDRAIPEPVVRLIGTLEPAQHHDRATAR